MCGEVKSLSGFNKDNRNKDGLKSFCKTCKRLRDKEYRQNNKDKISQNRRKHYNNNRSKVSQYSQDYYQNNRDRILWRKKEYYQSNQSKILRQKREYDQNNPDKRRSLKARRRATQRNATPPWADQTAINAIYAEALWLQEFTGEPYHVDHIVPLNSDFVCGLHVPANLQAIPGAENLAKNNRSWPEQLPCQTRRGIDHQWWNELQQKLSGMIDNNV
jgi:hypothetical protein